MADQTFKSSNQTQTEADNRARASSIRSASDQVLTGGRDMRDKAADVAESTSAAVKDRASEFLDAAKEAASNTGEKLAQTVEGQKNAGAGYVVGLAETMRRAAREFEAELPIVATYIRKAASQVEGVSKTIKEGNAKDLMGNVQEFARRQPTAFLGMAVLAGFGAVRFLKSSAAQSDRVESDQFNVNRQDVAGQLHSEGYRDDFTRSEGYRDEFTK